MAVREPGPFAKASLSEYLYSEAEQRWGGQDITKLAASLVNDPQDVCRRAGSEAHVANHVFLVNGDGTVAVLNTLRSQKVTGWYLMKTAGQVKRVATVAGQVYMLVAREALYFLERLEYGAWLDCSLSGEKENPQSDWNGLGHLAGQEVAVIADGAYEGLKIVNPAGEISLKYPAKIIEVGLPFGWKIETMPLAAQLADGTVVGKKKRIVAVDVLVRDSGDLWLEGNYIPLKDLDALINAPASLFTGQIKRRLIGWKETAFVTLEGRNSLPATILSVSLEVQIS